MIALALGELAEAIDGRLDAVPDAATVVTSVAVDSRQVELGTLFVAVQGERHDGHDFAAVAVDGGARAVLASRPVGVPAVLVEDTVAALGRLARAVLDRLPGCHVTGVTGSTGKTSTKDLLAGLLGQLGPTVAAHGSYNNEIGLPLTVLRADATTRHLVLEYSARGVGHIATLCAIAPPTVALELGVGVAHLGMFGSREAIAAAKGELVEALPRHGVAVLNADDPVVVGMASRTTARVVTFGRGPRADVRADEVALDELGQPSFQLHSGGEHVRVALRLCGEHHVSNALAAAAAALELGLDLPAVAAGLCAARPRSRWRMEVVTRDDGVVVVNDAYNANPDSMRAALRALSTLARSPYDGTPRRSWAVLGEMAELGPTAPAEHEAIGAVVAELGVHRLIVVGEGAEGIGRGAGIGERGVHVGDAGEAVEVLRAALRPGDVVLVKASRAVGLERVALELLAERA